MTWPEQKQNMSSSSFNMLTNLTSKVKTLGGILVFLVLVQVWLAPGSQADVSQGHNFFIYQARLI